MTLSNAERQKRYRDKKRGAPARVKNSKGDLLTRVASGAGMSRATWSMLKWIDAAAPDVIPFMTRGKHDGNGIRPTYERLRVEYQAAAFAALRAATPEQRDLKGWKLLIVRQDQQFVFKWTEDDGE